jgi:cysteine desulfurase
VKPIYLDYNATTPLAPSVREAMAPYWTERWANPSSAYPAGLAAMEAVEQARERVAQLLGAEADEIVFTSGGSEANNAALQGLMLDPARWTASQSSRGHLVISAIEHPSVAETARWLAQLDFEVTVVPPRELGRVDPADVAAAVRRDTRLVSVMHANNEIGAIQPIAEIARMCREHEVLLHTDAAQSVGKIRTRVDELQVDLLSLAGHKIYGPKGIGALFVRRGVPLSPLIHGGGQEHGLRAGTENVPLIVGLAQAAFLAHKSVEEFDGRIRALRDRLWNGLRSAIDGLQLYGDLDHCLPNTLCLSFPSVRGSDLLVAVPELSASTGSACHSRTSVASPTLRALHIAPEVAQGTVRLSLGWHTTSEEIERATALLVDAWHRLR